MSHVPAGSEPLTYAAPLRRPRPLRGILVWTVAIVVIGGMLMSVLLPSLCRSRESANRVKCESNLRQMGQAIALYARDNGGQYPPSLAVVLTNEDNSPSMMVCPSSNDLSASGPDRASVVTELQAAQESAPGHINCLSYVYTGRGLNTTTVSSTAVVAYEPLDNHNGDGTNVLFGDGHVEWIDKQTWEKMAATSGLAAGTPPTTRP